MADDAIEEAAERIQKCVKWSQGWAEANPDPVVADAVAEGLVTLGCLPKSRLKRMLEREVLDPETLTEGQMHYLNQQGLLDPDDAEAVDDGGDEEEEADDGDDGGVSIDDLDEEERRRIIGEIEKEVERRVADADGADDVDEETGQEAETVDDGDEEAEKADDGGDDGGSIRTASQAM
jgi:hypothetical protein